jgi:Neurotransmitter-gated ion-channel ligand binding domain/Neurotransmitter-gated ion-channel transmembrane region
MKKARKFITSCGKLLIVAAMSLPIFPTFLTLGQEQTKEQQPTTQIENKDNQTANSPIPTDYNKEQIPPNNGKPVPVSIGVYIINFAGINEPQETFQVVGYLAANWTDTRLKFDPKKIGHDTLIFNDKDQIWHPDTEIFNQVGGRNSARIQITVTPEGKVHYIESFDATISSDLQLKKFPFDKQRLRLIVDSFQYDDKQVIFTAENNKIGVNKEPFVSLSEWTIKDVKHEETSQLFPQDQKNYSRLNVYFEIERNSGFYVLKVFIPLAIIFSISCATFWIPIEELGVLTAIGVTNLLTAIAFSLSIGGALPKVAYLTFIDGFIGLIYLFIFISIIENVALHFLTKKDEKYHELSVKLHNQGRWSFPLGFVVGNTILWVLILI